MHIEILPGFSPHNKKWAENIKKEIQKLGEVNIVHWPHWKTGKAKDGWIEKEAIKLKNRVGDESIAIIAKSMGTLVAMEALKKDIQVEKLILCGVPIANFRKGDENRLSALKRFSAKKVVVFQNEEDPYAKPEEVASLLNKYNPDIVMMKKPRKDHHYPFAKDFKKFIKKTF